MCLAIPGRVIAFADTERHFASVEVSGVRRSVNIDLVRDEGLEVGDWVLIHVGFAMNRISDADAQETLKLLEMMGEAAAALEEVEGYRFAEDDALPPPRVKAQA